jgi:ribonucleoside-triphosphate reductase
MEKRAASTFDPISLVDGYVGKLDWRVKENSNMNYALQGLNTHITSHVIEHYWLTTLYTQELCDAHKSGALHLHDLSCLGSYCCGWDLFDLLQEGFGGVSSKTECKAPKHFGVALGQLVNFLYTLQGESAGAQAMSNVDTLLAPFIRYDKLSYKEVKQNLQEFVFNMNMPTRVGFQTPFTNISLDLTPSSILANMPVMIGGKTMPETYGEFQYEMDLFNRAFCEVMLEGDSKGSVFTFPIPTYSITKDFDWDNPNLDALWEMTAKFGIPYFSNFVNSDLNPEDARSMCCRLRLDNRELRKRGGGLFGANPLTGSLGVVTINLPRAAIQANKSKEVFFANIEKLLLLARERLSIKRDVIEGFTEKGLYPYSKVYLRKIKQARGSYWGNHFNTIGILGMHEACLNLLGEPIQSVNGKALAVETMQYLRGRLAEFQEDGNMYNLEATPGEGTTYRFARCDKKDFPDAHFSGETTPYYTNSTNLPVGHTSDIFDALQHQDDLQTLYTGGTVFHGFLGERIDDPQVAKRLVKKVIHQFKLPYFSLTPTFSICPEHGYIKGEHYTCPCSLKNEKQPSQPLERGTHERPTKDHQAML